MSKSYLPHFCVGPIIKGFGRGSRDLGIPTANFDLDIVQKLPNELETGIYFGWANIDNGDIYKAVISIGWNPFYNNKEKSLETHIIHPFNTDLYGKVLKVCICGYLRPEMNFDSMDSLIAAIRKDIQDARVKLDTEPFKQFQAHEFFTS